MAKTKNVALYKKYLQKMASFFKDKRASEILEMLSSGKNSYMRLDRLENSNFDLTWIDTIEGVIYDLGEIVNNPRETTKTVAGLVPVELARKTNSESIVHLASHTQYIKEVDERGNLIPSKVLNIYNEEDIHTYENRFIATFIRRLLLFIEKRYEFVKNFAILHDEEILYYKSKSIIDGAEVEIETKVKVKSDSETKSADISNKAVSRILKIREYVLHFYSSKFMKELKTDKDVRNPIIMTNILRKNPKYHHCYEVYKFIEKYDHLGVSYKVDEDASILSPKELHEINLVMLANYLALKSKDKSKETKHTSKVYKPKILTSIDDEEFIYGDLLKGPIEFLRIDEGYQAYLDSLAKKELPPHPTKVEREYYENDIEAKRKRKAEQAALDRITKQKKKEQAEFDRKARAIVAQREREEAERIAREEEAKRLEEERKLEEVRRQLVDSAVSEYESESANREELKEDEVIDTNPEEIISEEIANEEVDYEEEAPEEEIKEESEVDEVELARQALLEEANQDSENAEEDIENPAETPQNEENEE